MEKFNNFNVYELAISQDVYYRYFSKYKSARDDFIYSGYIEILENKDKLVGLVDLDYYRVCFNIACKGMNKFVITHRYKSLKQLIYQLSLTIKTSVLISLLIFIQLMNILIINVLLIT